MDPEEWVEAFRTSASIASPDSMQGAVAKGIADFLLANGIEAHVTAARSKDSIPLWDVSTPLEDTVSVFVRRRDVEKVLDVYKNLASGDMEIDESFDPGDPTPDV